MKKIKLQNSNGLVALVDDADYKFLNQFEWKCKQIRSGSDALHAVREIKIGGKTVTIRMHRLITEARTDQKVSHLNGNTLDNRRSNLKITTQRPYTSRSGRSGFRGVHQINAHHWKAEIEFSGRVYSLGETFTDPEIAAKEYDKAVVKLFGNNAVTNF